MLTKKITPKEKLILEQENNKLNEQHNLDYRLQKLRDRKDLYVNPTRLFNVGYSWSENGSEKFEIYNHEIVEVYDGLFYKIKHWGIKCSYGQSVKYGDNYSIDAWVDIYNHEKINDYNTTLSLPYTRRIQYCQSNVEAIIQRHYHFKHDYNPPYQRELVWDLKDKVDLIHSIYQDIEIGKFIFIIESDESEFKYSLLDGKQRINTLIEFFEDRFSYRGFYFSQLNYRDKNQFLNSPTLIAELKPMTIKEKIETFLNEIDISLKVNTTGKHVSKKHYDKVHVMLLNYVDQNNK